MSEEQASGSEIILYQAEDGRGRVEVRLQDGTVWLSQRLMAELYQVSVPAINQHISNIFEDQELAPEATIKKFLIVQLEGQRQVSRLVDYYNLDVILAVGYRVRSHRGAQFRRWASERMKEYLVKGFTLDDQRLKRGGDGGPDYFDELIERIRDIRASEKRFYQKIRDLYALSIDYDADLAETREFFQIVQNKLHWAVTGQTAAELIAGRADAGKPNMGLTSWGGVKVRKADITGAKNYLSEEEIRQLNRIVTMFLDYAEEQAERRRKMYMKDWREKLDGFLRFNEREVLAHAGQISAELAKDRALLEYDKFQRRRLGEEARAADELDGLARDIEDEVRRRG